MTDEKYNQLIKQVNLSSLKNKSLFITGGTGFFGYWLLNLFSILNHLDFNITITLLSRNPDFFLEKHPQFKNINWLTFIKGDVINYSYPETKFDMIIHGAADTSQLLYEKPMQIFEDIIFGTKHVLNHAEFCKVRRVLVISSGAVYGEVSSDTEYITEEINTSPITNKIENAYGEAKRASETLATCFAKEKNVEIIIARCFAFVGMGIGPHLIINILLQQAKNEEKIILKSSGKARRSFLHGRDLAIWLLKILIDGEAGDIYNVGSDLSYTIKKLAELIRNEMAPEKEIIFSNTLKNEQRINYVPSIEKAKKIGLNVWTTLNDAILETKN